MRWSELILGVAASAGCGESKPAASHELLMPSVVNVVEGGSTTFTIETTEQDLRGTFELGANSDKLQVTPKDVVLSPSAVQEITITGLIDSDDSDGAADISLVFDGGQREPLQVVMLDQQVQRAIPNAWRVAMRPASTATLDVRLTQPPTAPTTIKVVSNNTSAVYGKPFDLVFDATNYDVPQQVTLTSFDTLALGPVDLFLSSGFPTTTIAVIPVE